MEKINEQLAKEQEKLNGLLERKQKIEEKIKASEATIKKYTNMLNQQKFSAVNDVLITKGVSLEEVMAAIKSGDLISLQEKILTKENDNINPNIDNHNKSETL